MKEEEISEEEVAIFWDKNADTWAEHVRKGWDAYREFFNNPEFLRFIGNIKCKSVLDAGCGEGYNTRILARKGAKIVGIDISKKMIEFARLEEKRESLGVRYELASFTDLSIFEDESFDTVISFMALMDSPDYQNAVKEFFRVLRRNGNLFFSVTHPCFMTKGFEWIEDEKGKEIKLTVSDYFNNQPWIDHWKFSQVPNNQDVEPFAVPSFSWTLSDYLNTLIRKGFILKKIEEPRPSQEMCDKHPWLQRWRDHAAIFFYVCAVKP